MYTIVYIYVLHKYVYLHLLYTYSMCASVHVYIYMFMYIRMYICYVCMIVRPGGKVCVGLIVAWFFAASPIKRSSSVKATSRLLA